MVFESVLPSFDFNFGGILFTKNSDGAPKEFSCAPGLKGFEVLIEEEKHQLRILTSPDLQDQDQFIETIGDIICSQQAEDIYPKFIDYGVEHGLTYYFANLYGYTPLLKARFTIHKSVQVLTQFLDKLDRSQHFDFNNNQIHLESLWVNSTGDIIIVDLSLLQNQESTRKANIEAIIDCHLHISNCEKIETTTITRPQTFDQLKSWLAGQNLVPTETNFTPAKSKKTNNHFSLPLKNSDLEKKESKSAIISHPAAFEFETTYKSRAKYFWQAFSVLLLLMIGYSIYSERAHLSGTFTKLSNLSLSKSDTKTHQQTTQRAEGYHQPQLTLFQEVEFYTLQANQARTENKLLDALYYESQALELIPDDAAILKRINNDIYVLYENGQKTYGKEGLKLLYDIAAINPKANDIIVRHFQNLTSSN